MQDRLRLFLLLHLHKAGDKAGGADKELLDKLEGLLRDNKVLPLPPPPQLPPLLSCYDPLAATYP